MILPADLEEVPYAFCGHSHITEITIPASVRVIRKHALSVNHHLEKVVLNEGLETIEENAFGYCERLNSIILPATSSTISNNLGVSKLYCLPTVPPQLKSDGKINVKPIVYVREGCKATYEASTEWSAWAQEIIELDDEHMELAGVGTVQTDADATFAIHEGSIEVIPVNGKTIHYSVVNAAGITVATGSTNVNKSVALSPGVYVITVNHTSHKFMVK